jgi:hypothetical protein
MRATIPFSTIVRLAAITVGGTVFALIIPAGYDPLFRPLDAAIAVFSGIIIAILISHALERRRMLMESVRTELNKLRRLYHLSKTLAEGSPKLRAWFTDLHTFLYGYHAMFTGKNFDAYDQFNAEFRKLSYHMYELPALETMKEQVLYTDILSTTATVAEARQRIKELWDERFSTYVWVSVLLMAAATILAASLGLADALDSRLAGAAVIVSVLLAVDLLWKIDSMRSERKALAKRYVENVARLQLGRPGFSKNPPHA